jgi:uncharacterized membrane protein
MSLRRAPVTVMLGLVAIAIAQFAHYYPILPDRIAAHFGAGGNADGWNDTRAFMITYGIIEAMIVVMSLFVAGLIERAPSSAVNIPNREYWLAGDRRRGTIDYITEQFLWLECLTLAFLVAVAQIIFKLNLRGAVPSLPRDFWVTLIAFVAGIGWVCLRIVRRFGGKPPGTP